MALTKISGGVIQQPIDVGIITATSGNFSGIVTTSNLVATSASLSTLNAQGNSIVVGSGLSIFSSGTTQTFWSGSLDSKDQVYPNVSLAVQPPSAFDFSSSEVASKSYRPVVFSSALTAGNGTYTGSIIGVRNNVNVAGTSSNAKIEGYGSYNSVRRNSTTDISNSSSSQLFGTYNDINQGTNVSDSVRTQSILGTVNTINVSKGTATNIYGSLSQTYAAFDDGYSAVSTNIFGYNHSAYLGYVTGAGIATVTNLYSFKASPYVYDTASVNNYYGLHIDVLNVGVINNQYSVYSVDTESKMYHAGNIGIGTTIPRAAIDAAEKTDAIALPQGTTAQRPSGNNPYIRYNTTNSALEFYNGTDWVEIISDYFPSGSVILG